MNQYPTLWRYVLLVSLVVISVIYALPNLYGEDPAIQIRVKENASISETIKNHIASILSAQHLSYQSIQSTKNFILVRFHDTETQLKGHDLI